MAMSEWEATATATVAGQFAAASSDCEQSGSLLAALLSPRVSEGRGRQSSTATAPAQTGVIAGSNSARSSSPVHFRDTSRRCCSSLDPVLAGTAFCSRQPAHGGLLVQ